MGFVASLPFLLKAIVGPVGGVIADVLRNGYMTTANVRRLFYCIGKLSENANLSFNFCTAVPNNGVVPRLRDAQMNSTFKGTSVKQ